MNVVQHDDKTKTHSILPPKLASQGSNDDPFANIGQQQFPALVARKRHVVDVGTFSVYPTFGHYRRIHAFFEIQASRCGFLSLSRPTPASWGGPPASFQKAHQAVATAEQIRFLFRVRILDTSCRFEKVRYDFSHARPHGCGR